MEQFRGWVDHLGMSSRSTAPAPLSSRGHRPRLRAAVLVTGLAGALAFGQAGIAGAAPAPVVRHGLGGVLPSTSLAASTGLNRLAGAVLAGGGKLRAAATLPSEVSLTAFAVPPGNQGQHGACASWTTAYTMAGWESNYWHAPGAPFQPMFVYNQVNGGSDDAGTTFPDNFSVLETEGDIEASAWTHPFADYTSQPTSAELANAAKHVMTPHTTLFLGQRQGAAARTAIESAIADNRPVALGIPVYNSFFYLGPNSPAYGLASESGGLAGYHAVTVLGYNSTGVRIENSWGTTWGAGGYATLGWDFVESEVFEAEAAGTFVSTLTPSVTGLSRHVVAAAGGGPLTVTATRLTSVDTTSPSAVTFVSVADPSVVVNAPVTGRTSTALTVTAPALPDAGQYRVVVTGTTGASLPNATTDVVTAVYPYNVALAPGQAGRSNAASWVTLTGSDFGTTLASFTANQVGATVGGATAPVGWIDGTHLQVLVPAAPVGSSADLVLFRAGAASAPVSVPYLPPAPVVTRVSPATIAVAGGTPITVTVANGTGSAPEVQLVLGNGSAISAAVTARTETTITFTAPSAPDGLSQDRHVVVTGDGGPSAPSSTDVLGYRTPLSAHVASPIVSAAGGVVRLTGDGFGTSAAAFAAARITATANGVAAPLSWVSPTAVNLWLPAGKPGSVPAIVLLHDSLPGPVVTGTRYVAVITANSTPAGSRRGWTTAVRGVGLGAAHGWALLNSRGQVVRTLPVVTTRSALGSARHGAVLITSSTSATVRLPATAAGTYRLVFTPDQRAYPGSSLAATLAALLAFR